MLPQLAQNNKASHEYYTGNTATQYKSRTLINPNALPRELRTYKQYVLWQYRNMGGEKPEKCPINPKTLGNAGVNWSNTWQDIYYTVQVYRQNPDMNGIGFVLTRHDPYTMIDLDNCLIDGALSPLANEIVDRLGTYTEISPSGRGLRLFVHCPSQPGPVKRKEFGIEIYSSVRWATLTGNVLQVLPIARMADLNWLIERYTTPEKDTRPTLFFQGQRADLPADDQELWQRMFACKRGELIRSLYNGDVSVAHGHDRSGALKFLLNSLAFWTQGDTARMARMIRQTGLDQAKWDTRRGNSTYLDYQISETIQYMKGRR